MLVASKNEINHYLNKIYFVCVLNLLHAYFVVNSILKFGFSFFKIPIFLFFQNFLFENFLHFFFNFIKIINTLLLVKVLFFLILK